MVLARKHVVFRKYKRNKIMAIISQMEWCLANCQRKKPYRVALFWLEAADRTWGWSSL
jgi:hypothetical protein